MRRSEREITDRIRLHDILDRSQVCRLVLHDQPYPYIVPVNYVRVDERIYFHSAPEGRKMELLRRDPRIRFEVDRLIAITEGQAACRWGALYESVIGAGPARIVETLSEKEMALHGLMEKYSGRSGWVFAAAALKAVVVVRIDIQDLSGKTTSGGDSLE